MGNGEVSGNGSVHWAIDHENGQDLKVKDKDATRPPKSGVTNVHTKTRALGRDPIAIEEVGRSKGHTNRFRVTLRFERENDAQNAAGATPFFDSGSGMWTLVLDVPVIGRSGPDDAPPAEIRIDW